MILKRFLVTYLSLYPRRGERICWSVGFRKSTIFNLIERMYDIESGDIKYGTQSIYDVPITNWRNKIGYVMQSNSMMSGTIRDNILYGINREVSDEELVKYAKLANCHDFIMQFDDGYDTLVGERGLKLSGGQRQRIDIARSFVKILIFYY